jgi:F0F1-type ATP synthase delta subunit
MWVDPIVHRYSRLLESVAPPRSLGKRFLSELQTWKNLIAQNPEGWGFLTSGGCSATLQSEKVGSLLDKMQASELTRQFVHLVRRHNHLAKLLPILQAYSAAASRGKKIETVVKTARPLTDDQVKALKNGLSALCPSGIWLRTEVDPELLGGGVVFFDDWMLDGSVKTILNRTLA